MIWKALFFYLCFVPNTSNTLFIVILGLYYCIVWCIIHIVMPIILNNLAIMGYHFLHLLSIIAGFVFMPMLLQRSFATLRPEDVIILRLYYAFVSSVISFMGTMIGLCMIAINLPFLCVVYHFFWLSSYCLTFTFLDYYAMREIALVVLCLIVDCNLLPL